MILGRVHLVGRIVGTLYVVSSSAGGLLKDFGDGFVKLESEVSSFSVFWFSRSIITNHNMGAFWCLAV